MLFDGINMINSSVAENFIIQSGEELPTAKLIKGKLFNLDVGGLHIFNGVAWKKIAGAAPTGGGGAVAEPTSTTFTYDLNGDVAQITEIINEEPKVRIFDYENNRINTITTTFNGETQIETFLYDIDGNVQSINLS